MGERTRAVKCLDCDTTVAPEGVWQQCECGHLYVDGTTEPPRVGFLNEDRVEYTEGQKLGPLVTVVRGKSQSQQKREKVQRSGDQWTESETFK